ncbi:sunset domain-containing protein [Sinorhizobium psoraleae]|uniref:Thermonuclease family protein n=1 Tax=Sinorhizobium psoraleae TaxID=520838 RepID=A0ABT4KIA8_9HYPH|nr:hypothetical protein [Sinorhizobium psoraleae]MCZ4091701.1 hypothetical protein [Sinorhizobium psoraleae]
MGKVVDFDPRKRQRWKTGRNAPGQHRQRASQRPALRRKSGWIPGIAIVAAIALFGISQYVPLIPGCDIKANISYNTGERIYHVPGQEYYSQTRVNYLNRERWFCSEEAAREAGWRRAHD